MLQVIWNGLINHYPSHPHFCFSLCSTFRHCQYCIIPKFRWKLLQQRSWLPAKSTSCLSLIKATKNVLRKEKKKALPYSTSIYTSINPASKEIGFNHLEWTGYILWKITKIPWAHSKEIKEEGRCAATASAMPHPGLELTPAIGVTTALLEAITVLSPQEKQRQVPCSPCHSAWPHFILGTAMAWWELSSPPASSLDTETF